MVRTIEKEFCTACNPAELSDPELIMIDWIVIQYIIPLKLCRIMYKIMIHRIISNLDIGVRNHIFQIDSLWISCPWMQIPHERRSHSASDGVIIPQ